MRKFPCLAILCVALVSIAHAEDLKTLDVPGGQVEIRLENGSTFELPKQVLIDWVQNASKAVTTYYGRYPLQRVVVDITIDDRPGIHHGVTRPRDGEGDITISVGKTTTQLQLDRDWMMTHEMVHLALPELDDSHHWLEEGLATYVEPLGRVQAGLIKPEKVWSDLVDGLPKGEPEPGDQGLDVTQTWGRTYWGGALFCLEADLEIVQQTHGKKSLQDALRGIVAANLTITKNAEILDVLQVGDKVVGVPVLVELYRKWATTPITVDLDALWKQLGVVGDPNNIHFSNNAPLAWVRERITTGSQKRSVQ